MEAILKLNQEMKNVNVTVAAISAVCPCESATSGWTKPSWSIFARAWNSPLKLCRTNSSELASKGPFGPKLSLFIERTAATFHLTFSASRLKETKTEHEPVDIFLSIHFLSPKCSFIWHITCVCVWQLAFGPVKGEYKTDPFCNLDTDELLAPTALHKRVYPTLISGQEGAASSQHLCSTSQCQVEG